MIFALSLSDISLWLAFTAILLLVASELIRSLPEYSGRILVDKTRLRLGAFGCGLGFLVTVALRVFTPF
jgi:hypothetical protein